MTGSFEAAGTADAAMDPTNKRLLIRMASMKSHPQRVRKFWRLKFGSPPKTTVKIRGNLRVSLPASLRTVPSAFRPSLLTVSSAQSDRDNSQKELPMTNIFVGNLSFRTTQDELHAAFAQYGNVERVNIVTDRDSGQSRGFAFVEMSESTEAQNAISQLNGAELNGRAMNVNEARPKPAGGGGFGGGGGRGGNGGGYGGGRGRGNSGGGGRGSRW
jgi:RNA recognition motif-containing protein